MGIIYKWKHLHDRWNYVHLIFFYYLWLILTGSWLRCNYHNKGRAKASAEQYPRLWEHDDFHQPKFTTQEVLSAAVFMFVCLWEKKKKIFTIYSFCDTQNIFKGTMLRCGSDVSLQHLPVECCSLSGYIYLIISDFRHCWHIFKNLPGSHMIAQREGRQRKLSVSSVRGTQRQGAWEPDMRCIFQSLRNFSLHTTT